MNDESEWDQIFHSLVCLVRISKDRILSSCFNILENVLLEGWRERDFPGG